MTPKKKSRGRRSMPASSILGGIALAGIMGSVIESTKKCACYQEGYVAGMERAVSLIKDEIGADEDDDY